MINGDIEKFLDTGWYSESTLYYNGFVYWCEGYTDFDNNKSKFFVDRWEAICDDHKLYHEYRDSEDNLVNYSRVYEDVQPDMDSLKKRFLIAPIFDGKSFWEIQQKLIWVEEGSPVDKGANKEKQE